MPRVLDEKCPSCDRHMEMCYVPWCPYCDDPTEGAKKVVIYDWFKCSRKIEVLLGLDSEEEHKLDQRHNHGNWDVKTTNDVLWTNMCEWGVDTHCFLPFTDWYNSIGTDTEPEFFNENRVREFVVALVETYNLSGEELWNIDC